VPGVLRVTDVHFWSQSGDQYVGTLKVVVDSRNISPGDDQKIKERIHSCVTTELDRIRWLTIQIDRDIVVVI
jgi:Co/Zn/Cd efflux system component